MTAHPYKDRVSPVRRLQAAITLTLTALLLGAGPLLHGCDENTARLHIDRVNTYSTAPYNVAIDLVEFGGRIDYALFTGYPADALAKVIALHAEHGPRQQPRQFPREPQRAAYYINAHNAMVLQLWLDHGAPTAGPSAELDPAWLDEKRFNIDGRDVSVNDVRRLVDRQTIPLSQFALMTGTRLSPPVPRALDPSNIDQDLQLQTLRTLNCDWAFRDGKADDAPGTVYALPVVLGAADEPSALRRFLDRYISRSAPRTLRVLEAAGAGLLLPMPPDFRINSAAADNTAAP